MVVAAELADRVLHRVLGGALQPEVERRAHHEGAVRDRAEGRGIDQLLHLIEGVVEIVAGGAFVAAVDRHRRVAAGAEHLAFGHESRLDQVVEHHVGAGAGGRQVDMRGEPCRRLEQAGQHGGLGEVHLARRLAEIELRGGIDPERAAAHIGAVEIELEDLVLGEPRLQPQREERFLHLALDGALVAQEQVLGELLGDRGAALHHAPGARIGDHGAHGAGDVDAEMLVEAAVLGGEHRLDQMIGKVRERDGARMLDAAAADLVAVTVEEHHRELGLLQPVFVRGLAERRHRERERQQQAAGAHGGELGQRLHHEPAAPSRHMEAVHEVAEPLEHFARHQAAAEQAEIEPGVDIEQIGPEALPPAGSFLVWNLVLHGRSRGLLMRRRHGAMAWSSCRKVNTLIRLAFPVGFCPRQCRPWPRTGRHQSETLNVV